VEREVAGVNLRRGAGRVSRPLVLAAALLSMLAFAPGARAAFPGPNGKIAYFSGGDIYTANPDGTEATNITNSWGVYDSGPTWSADGNRIAFLSNRGECGSSSCGANPPSIWVMNADGTDPVRVYRYAGYTALSWSPDGKRIAFSSVVSSYTQIFEVDVDGTGLTQVTNGGSQNADPAWSPDGATIAFSHDGALWKMKDDLRPEPKLVSRRHEARVRRQRVPHGRDRHLHGRQQRCGAHERDEHLR
jgi:Tol biopolymer transport system component